MNIGIDVDGVLFPIEEYQLTEGKKFFRTKPIVNENGYGIKEVFNCSVKEEVIFWIRKTFNFNRNVVVPAGMAEMIQKLRSEGNKVYIVTSRALADKDNILGKIMRSELEKALKRNGIEVDGIIYTSVKNMENSKKEIIEKYNINIMIDDKKEVVDALKNSTHAICYETRNNKDYSDAKVKKVSNVEELEFVIATIINEYKNSRIKDLHYTEINELSSDEQIGYFEALREAYKKEVDVYGLEKGEAECEKIVGKLRKLCNTIYRPNIIDGDKFPTGDGIIMAANHLHSYDPLLVLAPQMKNFHLLAKSELKDDKIFNKLFTSIGSIFVDNSDPESRKRAKEDLIKAVLNGGNIMMFPEGTRNRTEERLLDFHMGTVSIAQITGAPIYPFAVNKDYKLFNNSLCVAVGEPIYVKPNDNLVEKNEELKRAISELLKKVENYEEEKRTSKR